MLLMPLKRGDEKADIKATDVRGRDAAGKPVIICSRVGESEV